MQQIVVMVEDLREVSILVSTLSGELPVKCVVCSGCMEVLILSV